MVNSNEPKEYPPAISPCFMKGINIEIIKTKGITTRDLLRMNVTGIFESRINMTISKPYKAKARNEVGFVRIINKINVTKPIILILASNLWMKLFILLYLSI